MIEEALTSVLKNNAGIAAVTTRVYPGNVPQDASLPLIFYVKVSGSPDHSVKGPTDLAQARFQIEAWAYTYLAAKQLAALIETALDGKKATVGSDYIRSVVKESERDMYEPELSCHRVSCDYSIWYR